MCEHTIGRRVIDEAFGLRVPFQLSVQKHRDIAQVTNAARAVTDFRCADCIPSALNAIQEVLLVVVAVVQVNLIRPYFGCQKRLRLSIYFAARYKNPSFTSLETYITSTGFEMQFDAVGVCVLYICRFCSGE